MASPLRSTTHLWPPFGLIVQSTPLRLASLAAYPKSKDCEVSAKNGKHSLSEPIFNPSFGRCIHNLHHFSVFGTIYVCCEENEPESSKFSDHLLALHDGNVCVDRNLFNGLKSVSMFLLPCIKLSFRKNE